MPLQVVDDFGDDLANTGEADDGFDDFDDFGDNDAGPSGTIAVGTDDTFGDFGDFEEGDFEDAQVSNEVMSETVPTSEPVPEQRWVRWSLTVQGRIGKGYAPGSNGVLMTACTSA